MSHKADESFFDAKRPWSKRKDRILDYYLKPYLGKMSRRRRPILLVDGFAGPGAFRDGEPGSPTIIAERAKVARSYPSHPTIDCWFIERVKSHCEDLQRRFGADPAVNVRHAPFREVLPEIRDRARSSDVFLYLDPFTVEGLEWEPMDRLFRILSQGDISIEVLANFNTDALCRRGRAALRMAEPAPDAALPESDWESREPPEAVRLDAVVGGKWWREILRKSLPYPEEVRQVTNAYCEQLRTRFREVFSHEVKELERHQVPKYVMIFASRHPDTLVLMNDAMRSSHELQAAQEAPPDMGLFESRSESLVPDIARLSRMIWEMLDQPLPRRHLIERICRLHFDCYSSTQIRECIQAMVKASKLAFESKTRRLNEDAILRRT